MLEALILAIGLAMDATAVATARSISGVARRQLLVLAFAFGVFQGGMAAGGWLLGSAAAQWIARWDHWIAFVLLLAIGGKMLFEALGGAAEGDDDVPAKLGGRMIIVLSIATSIDALAAGVTLPALDAPPAIAVLLIGIVTFVLSVVGGLIGGRLGKHLGTKLEVVGGIVLIGIGTKILIEHLTA